MSENATEPLIHKILEDIPGKFGNLKITFQQDSKMLSRGRIT